MIRLLEKQPDLSQTEIAERLRAMGFKVSQPTVSRELRKLRKLGETK